MWLEYWLWFLGGVALGTIVFCFWAIRTPPD